ANLNLLKLLNDDLSGAVRTTVAKARVQRSTARKEVAWAKSRRQRRRLTIQVIPFRASPARDELLLVLFEDSGPLQSLPAKALRIVTSNGGSSGDGEAHAPRGEVERLRTELDETRESLQAVIEEQEATNEELRSANEEG